MIQRDAASLLLFKISGCEGGVGINGKVNDVWRRRILIIGSGESRALAGRLARGGFETRLETSIESAVRSVRKSAALAILIDEAHTEVDVLEFLMNMQDIGMDVPVLVLHGKAARGQDPALSRIPRGFVLKEFTNADALIDELSLFSERRMKQGGRNDAATTRG